MNQDSKDLAVFGYGSLILPNSILGRINDEIKRKKEDFIGEREYERAQKFFDFYSSEEVEEAYLESDIQFIPAKVFGFERYYSLERSKAGNQLVVEKSDPSDFVNGVIAYPLTDEEFENLADTEEGYKNEKVGKDRIETYVETEIPEEAVLFYPEEGNPQNNKDTEQSRNDNYHQFITEGVENLAEIWFNDTEEQKKFREEFMRDFNESTYEKHEGNWEKLSEIKK